MTLKRLYVWAAALLVGVAVAACQKEPDSSDLNDDYLVYTDYDSTQDFARYDTFFIPDSILIIGGLLTSNSRLNQKRTLEGVEQAFRQSPYLHK